MTRRLRYSSDAESSLDEIADWTFDQFGPRQAEVYMAKLHGACHRLADGVLRGRSARAEWGGGIAAGLLFVRVERHVVLFVETAEEVVIVDVLHGAMDLPRRVTKP